MKDANFQVRLEAVQGIGGMGRPGSSALLDQTRKALIACINDGGRSPRATILHIWAYTALVGLAEIDDREREKHLRGISTYLHKKFDPEVRGHAAQALGALGKQAKSQVPILLAQLYDRQPFAVQGACLALAAIGDSSPKVIAGLRGVLATENPANVSAACQVLVHFKAKQPEVIDSLKALLASKEPINVLTACQALAHFKAGRPDVLNALQEQLDRPNLDKGLKGVLEATVKHLVEPAKKERP
jgi:HEAT repeat protein